MNTAAQILRSHRLGKTYWGKRIIAAEARGKFTESNKIKASDWITCACGKQDKRIPRESLGRPVDTRLINLGIDFMNDVGYNQCIDAARTLVAIEKQACVVLRQAVAK